VFRTRTLAEALDTRQDNFLLLRFLAASLVIYGHGPSISAGLAWPDLFAWLGWGTYSGDMAVDVFFVTSGYMIAGSYLRRRHLPDFLWARALRIYPAYLFCLLACALALGPVFSSLPPKAYLADHGVLHYVSKNLELGKGLAWYLPGVFTANPLAGIVNGSIWTLPAEVRMYLWAAALGVLGLLARPRWCNAALALLFASDGYQLVLGGLVRSFTAIPLTTPIDIDRLGRSLAGSVTQLFVAALQIAGPVIAVIFLANIALGLLTRVSPAMNAYTLGPPAFTLVTVVLTGFGIVALPAIVTAIAGRAGQLIGAG